MFKGEVKSKKYKCHSSCGEITINHELRCDNDAKLVIKGRGAQFEFTKFEETNDYGFQLIIFGQIETREFMKTISKFINDCPLIEEEILHEPI